MERRIVELQSTGLGADENSTLAKNIARAVAWIELPGSSEASSLSEIARKEGLHRPDVSRILSLAFPTPRWVEGVLDSEPAAAEIAEAISRSTRHRLVPAVSQPLTTGNLQSRRQPARPIC